MRVSLNLLKMDLLRLVKKSGFLGRHCAYFLFSLVWEYGMIFKISSADVVYYVSLSHLTIFLSIIAG